MNFKFVIGIDEAGRGPLAGPVSLGAVCFEFEIYHEKLKSGFFEGLKDSKKLSEKKREAWLQKMNDARKEKVLDFAVCFAPNTLIDKKGIAPAIRFAISGALKKFDINPTECLVLLDGALKAPPEFTNQKTIIKGDESEPIISLASIGAKVFRDRKMKELAKDYPEYCFEIHKGYGTKKHMDLIRKHGMCEIHRRSFCKNI